MRVTSKGQVTIPQEIRERFGFLPHTEVDFVVEEGAVLVKKASSGNERARQWLHNYRGSLKGGMSTDELMRLTRGED